MASFSGPARSIYCARTICNSAGRLGIRVKAGLHTGECVLGKNLGGVAVELAQMVASEAPAGEVLVSRTVKDLAAGSGLELEEFRVCSFENTEGEWRLYSVKAK